jgi:crotonobetainyl-CoA:carnitine CoA-transferase CaiB-like acyl-CoA transferase
LTNLNRALEGIKVVDFSQVGAGPACGMLLGDMGADVLKVEAPGGDIGRKLGPPWQGGESVVSMSFNRNKRSIVLDLKKPDGVTAARRLIAAADVVLESFRPGVMQKLGLGYVQLSQAQPRLIFCSVSAYGQGGPWRDKPGVDGIIQAVSGLMSLIGEEGAPPMKVQTPAADVTTGFLSTLAVVAALHERNRSGLGQHLDMCLYNSALMLQQSALASYLSDGEKPVRSASAAPYSAPNEAYPTKDGWIQIAAYHEERWRKFCGVIGLEAHEDFDANPKRVANRTRLFELVSEKLKSRTTSEWIVLLEAADIICGPIADYDEVARSPQAAHNGVFVEMQHPTAGIVRMPGFAVGDRDAQSRVHRPPPRIGEHAREILAEHGYAQSEIDALLASGAVKEGA